MIQEWFTGFHFLRPEWLWGIVGVCVLGLMLFIHVKHQESWKKSVSENLLPYLMIRGKGISLVPKIFILMVLLLAVLAIAGPSWKKNTGSDRENNANVVIVLDASLSMLAGDIPPNRFERAKQKTSDLLDEVRQLNVAVVAFAGSAHLVIPFTSDIKAVKYMVNSLLPALMPLKGSNLPAALHLADSLLNPLNTPANIVVLTDDIPEEADGVSAMMQSKECLIQYLLLATPAGAAIPCGHGRFVKDKRGETVIPRLNVSLLQRNNVSSVTLDQQDVVRINSAIRESAAAFNLTEQKSSECQDVGYWVLIPVAFLFLLWFRRGWMVQWCLIGTLTLGLDSCELRMEPLPEDFTFADLWLTRDQQGQRLLDKGRLDEALKVFENPMQKAMILYKQQDYAGAAAVYSLIPSPEGYFNLGVVQAELHNWEASRDAFSRALEAQPGFTEAQDNLDFVNRILKSRNHDFVSPQDQDDGTSPDEQRNGESQEGGEEQASGSTGQSVSKGPADSYRESDFMSGIMKDDHEMDLAKEMVIRQLSDDPAEFLRRRFEYQIKSGRVKAREGEIKW